VEGLTVDEELERLGQWREPNTYSTGDRRLGGVCAQCRAVLALATWSDGGQPLIWRARRVSRRLPSAGRGKPNRPPEVRRVKAPVPGKPTFEFEHRWVTDGPPLAATDALAGKCQCGMPYRVWPKSLQRRAREAAAAGKDRFTIPRS
jgi:hypothetical protein